MPIEVIRRLTSDLQPGDHPYLRRDGLLSGT